MFYSFIHLQLILYGENTYSYTCCYLYMYEYMSRSLSMCAYGHCFLFFFFFNPVIYLKKVKKIPDHIYALYLFFFFLYVDSFTDPNSSKNTSLNVEMAFFPSFNNCCSFFCFFVFVDILRGSAIDWLQWEVAAMHEGLTLRFCRYFGFLRYAFSGTIISHAYRSPLRTKRSEWREDEKAFSVVGRVADIISTF